MHAYPGVSACPGYRLSEGSSSQECSTEYSTFTVAVLVYTILFIMFVNESDIILSYYDIVTVYNLMQALDLPLDV